MDNFNVTADRGCIPQASRDQSPFEAQHSELAAVQSETLSLIAQMEDRLSHVLVSESPTKPGDSPMYASPTPLAEMLNGRIDGARNINARLERLLGRIHL